MKKTRLVGVIVAVAVGAAIVGWLAGTTVETPSDAAARTAAPEPSPILVPAEVRELSTDVITRGTGKFGSPVVLSLTPSRLKSDSGVVTSVPDVGDEVGQGEVLLTVSGRPVFVLQGSTPAYRDIGPNMEGADVRQLEEALAALGIDTGVVDGRFDAATDGAVRTLYDRSGVQPIVATDEQLAALGTIEDSLVAGSTRGAGVQLPADEVVFAPVVPVRVSELGLLPGEPVEGALITVTDATVAVDGSVPIESAGLIDQGMRVVIDEPDLGINAEGEISFVAPGPGTHGVDGFHVYFEVEVPDAPPNLANASVRLTIPTESTAGPVLAVPISALSLAPDGSSRVRVSRNGEMTFVDVEPGLSAQGFVEVSPVGATLEAGDLVVVGFGAQSE